MKYVALVYYDERIMKAMSQQQWDALNRECLGCVESLSQSGSFLAGQALENVDHAATVRVREGEVTVTDGPFAETREQLAGFYLLEARDLNDAIRIAGRIPPARHGSVEVRPVREVRPEGNSAGGQASETDADPGTTAP
ncbi:YciI family protein [Sediminicurvatus halobius]|uniref:Dehydrogenase n=1 Tax=Sediminicurvatus halobius TaxID=2182432 RepID=A0A2U2N8W9_9GAMM|nr:YciI family protein [Spiribacter halobius]PWG65389.1 dehydrogenase [Spiribacter halobius]UEX79894.1 YciI family protein [Spiribacter halobius]